MEQLVDEIAALRRRLGDAVCIMGHHYQNDAIVAFCDVTGDSLELARRVPDIRAQHIVFCGVHFMGESAALLASPEQAVHVPAPDADCEMARMAPAAQARAVLERLRALGRKVTPLAYVNTTLALKAVVGEYGGAVCTSANAEQMLRWALDQGDGVLFLPSHMVDFVIENAFKMQARDLYAFPKLEAGVYTTADVDAPVWPLPRPIWPPCPAWGIFACA